MLSFDNRGVKCTQLNIANTTNAFRWLYVKQKRLNLSDTICTNSYFDEFYSQKLLILSPPYEMIFVAPFISTVPIYIFAVKYQLSLYNNQPQNYIIHSNVVRSSHRKVKNKHIDIYFFPHASTTEALWQDHTKTKLKFALFCHKVFEKGRMSGLIKEKNFVIVIN